MGVWWLRAVKLQCEAANERGVSKVRQRAVQGTVPVRLDRAGSLGVRQGAPVGRVASHTRRASHLNVMWGR